MHTLLLGTLACLAHVILGVSISAQTPSPIQVNTDFRNGIQGWEVMPSGLMEIRRLPAEMNEGGTGLYFCGDALCGGGAIAKRHLGPQNGIVPGQAYDLDYTIVFASNLGSVNGHDCGAFGLTLMMAGGSGVEPSSFADVDPEYGPFRAATSFVGGIGNGLPCNASRYISVTRIYHYRTAVIANSNGELWLLTGGWSIDFGASFFFQNVNVKLTPVNSLVRFSQENYSVNEPDGVAHITVTRTGDLSSPATVNYTYSPSDTQASLRTDFEPFFGRLSFAAGETTKIFPVLIIDNKYSFYGRSINVTLSEETGGGLGSPNVATVQIINDDVSSGPSPVNDPQFFVRQHYYDFLSRLPDSGGLQFWINQITSCGSDAQCSAQKRENVSAAFFLSIEFQRTGYLVYRFYDAALDRSNGLPRFIEFVRDTQLIGQDVVVGATGWEQQLEQNTQDFAQEFVTRAEFTALYPETMTPAQFVDAVYQHGGITPTAAERQAALDEFNTPTGARGRVMRRVAENETLFKREFNRAFVLMQYFGYLRRNPDDLPDANLNGYNFWLSKLNQTSGNYQAAEMVKAFIVSSEYRQRFGL